MDNKKNEELQSRREFFKSAAKAALPVMMLATGITPLLSSCNENAPSGCGKSCSGSCSGGCQDGCDAGCGGSCDKDCYKYSW